MKTNKCVACGSKEFLHHHHLYPKSLGGSDDDTNLITLCHICHGRIHNTVFYPRKELSKNARCTKKKQRFHLRPTDEERLLLIHYEVRPLVEKALFSGCRTKLDIANFLNDNKCPVWRNEPWDVGKVNRLLRMYGIRLIPAGPDLNSKTSVRKRLQGKQCKKAVGKKYQRDVNSKWNHFKEFCKDRQLPHLPAAPATVAEYIKGKPKRLVNKICAAISREHAKAGFRKPTLSDEVKAVRL